MVARSCTEGGSQEVARDRPQQCPGAGRGPPLASSSLCKGMVLASSSQSHACFQTGCCSPI